MSVALIVGIGTALAAVLGAILGGKNTVAVLKVLKGHDASAELLAQIAADVKATRASVHDLSDRVSRLESFPCHRDLSGAAHATNGSGALL
jgi:hypothetical protein